MDPPTRPMFHTLPTELLHVIFSHVEGTEDFIALRLTCSLFASGGLDHFEPEVPLIFHRDKFKALTEIAAHPKLSKHMSSLFYVSDRCRLMKYETWDKKRPDPRPWEQEDFDWTMVRSTGRDLRVFERNAKRLIDRLRQRTASVPESVRREGYKGFTALCEDVVKVESEGYDQECLRALFKGCTKLKEVTVASRMDTRRELNASRKIDEITMSTTNQDRQWWKAGFRQVISLAMAAQQAGTRLDSLTLAAVSPLLFDVDVNVNAEEWSALKALVRPLRRLRLFTLVEPPDQEDQDGEIDYEEPDPEDFQLLVDDIFNSGNLHEILLEARDLRVLKLQLPHWIDPDTGGPMYTTLDLSLKNITWPHLYELSLSSCEMRSDYLVDLCLRHKSTLRRLSFFDLQTSDWGTSWKEILTSLSGKLPELRLMKLRGSFHVCDEEDMSFEIGGIEPQGMTPHRNALENFVIRGGPWPSDDPALLSDPGDYRDESQEPLGELEDNMNLDDPVLDYEVDEFDVRI